MNAPQMNWQPIDTAPRDVEAGSIFLLLSACHHVDDYEAAISLGFWGSAYGDREPFWCDWGSGLIEEYDDHEEFPQVPSVTHWMPLPAPPATLEAA